MVDTISLLESVDLDLIYGFVASSAMWPGGSGSVDRGSLTFAGTPVVKLYYWDECGEGSTYYLNSDDIDGLPPGRIVAYLETPSPDHILAADWSLSIVTPNPNVSPFVRRIPLVEDIFYFSYEGDNFVTFKSEWPGGAGFFKRGYHENTENRGAEFSFTSSVDQTVIPFDFAPDGLLLPAAYEQCHRLPDLPPGTFRVKFNSHVENENVRAGLWTLYPTS